MQQPSPLQWHRSKRKGPQIKTLKLLLCQPVSGRFYHPARMAVVAVGDFDAKIVEQQIKDEGVRLHREADALQAHASCATNL